MWYIAQSNLAILDRSAQLTWAENTEPDLAGYHVYMSINDDLHFTRMTSVPLSVPWYVSPLLRLDEKYFFQVTAVDVHGNESPASAVIEFQLHDGTFDPSIMVPPPHAVSLLAGATVSQPTITSVNGNCLTQFTWKG